MSVAPGLAIDGPAVLTRVFLGQQPGLKVEAMLTRQMAAVYPWFTSRKRLNEQGSVFMELDASGCDAETILRYSHTFYVRRVVHQDLLEKQLNALETGKPPKEASAAVLQALGDANALCGARIAYEEKRLTSAKARSRVPFRRELDPDSPLDPWDILAMMRCVGEDETAVDAERRAKAFLPASKVDDAILNLGRLLIGADAQPLDKKFARLLTKNIPSDYDKVGCVPKLRPIDVTTRARFIGERSAGGSNVTPFQQLLWGNVFRRYATSPAFLQFAGSYWPVASGMITTSADATMPADVAAAATTQQTLFAAHRFRAQYLYTSIDHSKQGWRTDSFVPLPRLLPIMGHTVAEDLVASLLVDSWWTKNVESLGELANPMDDSVVRAVRAFVLDSARLREEGADVLLSRAVDAAKTVLPPLTEAESQWQPPVMETPSTAATAEADDTSVVADEGDHAESRIAVPNETL